MKNTKHQVSTERRESRSKMKYIMFLLLSIVSVTVFAEEHNPLCSITDVSAPHYLLGFELAELAQNSFRNIGPENWTIHYGQILTERKYFNYGWSATVFKVNLAPEHIQDLNQAPFITGNRDNLTGDLSVMRIGADVETINFSFFPVSDRYLLRLIPLLGLNTGYYKIGISNSITKESFDFSSITVGARSAIRVTVFDILYYDFQVDYLLFAVNNNSGIGTVGDANINLSNRAGMQVTMNIGIMINKKMLFKQ